MNIYAGTLGQLIIVEVFVSVIWLRVLFDAVRNRSSNVSHKRLLLTSFGLVLNALSIAGIMGIRVYQLMNDPNSFVWTIVAFYVMLAIGNVMFIIAACIGGSTKLLTAFLVTTGAWFAYVTYVSL